MIWLRVLVAFGLVSMAHLAGADEVLKLLEAPEARLSASGTPAGRATPIATLERPPITTTCWAVRGDVKTRDVSGKGYLEMWSAFPDGSRYFSRTLGEVGPMKHLSGTSGPRRFVLPFTSREGMPAPIRLELAVVLPGEGQVELSNVALVQYGPREDPLAEPGAWFTDQSAGVAGGIVGGFLGCVGALIGLLAGRGKARALVLALAYGTIATGVLFLFIGAFALLRGQPFRVWGSLLLVGTIATAVMGGNLGSIRRRYEAKAP